MQPSNTDGLGEKRGRAKRVTSNLLATTRILLGKTALFVSPRSVNSFHGPKFDSLIYKGAAVTAGARGTYHSRVVRRTVVRFCPQKCIEQNIAYCRFHLKILSLQHAEILGHVICSEKSLDALFREQESEALMEALSGLNNLVRFLLEEFG